ncbi:hypothetical protein KIW84_071964 [Lathyrus oleraceus]|uniref:Caffeoyl-CoA O-methyltransferase n=1 Tax=Pisum sativum TaxID=3888 RepID=A0A9D4VKU1_PEA|nr:hypothetical protein KIW84_071964 [Pisum sativum]
MRGTLNPVYRGDPELEKTLRLLRRFQLTGHFPKSPPPFLTVYIEEQHGFVQEYFEQEEVVMADNDIIGIANDKARNIRDYDVFDPKSMNTGIIRPEITVAQFEFKPMMFQMLQAIGKYSRSANDDPHLHLRQLLEAANNFKIPGILDDSFRLREHFMSVPIDEAQFLSILLKTMNAKKTLEIGVFTGYSLLATALALPSDGKITAIDVDREAYEVGLPFIEKAGVEHKVEFILGDALSVLHDLVDGKQEESFDYVFVDAAKDQYIKYHEQVLKLMRKGGIVAYDNTLWAGSVAMSEDDEMGDHIKPYRKPLIEFNKFIASDSRIESIILSVGDGLTLCRKV